jgi:predicted transcriptional regulator
VGSKKLLPELTKAELDVMKVLWHEGRLSARELHERLSEDTDWAYSTTRTVMDRMVEKGVLAKQPFHGINLYEPRISKAMGLARLVRDFAARVLEVDPASVVPLFAQGDALTAAELDEMSRLLEDEER